MRNYFDTQLELLNRKLTDMGTLCETAISTAIGALMTGDGEKAQDTFKTDTQIDQMERDIETLCMKLLLQQQPVARDLRIISSALKMISDMERIGDQASDIAEITRFITNTDFRSKTHLRNMADSAIQMVTDSINSFVRKDLELAEEVIAYDDVVDNLFNQIKLELIGLIAENPADGENCIDLLMVAKYLERIGDHATNIAEWVIYSLTGKHESIDSAHIECFSGAERPVDVRLAPTEAKRRPSGA